MKILRLFAAALMLLFADSMQAQTQIDLIKQVKGVLLAANRGVLPRVATGSVLVSNGASDPAVYQTKLGYDVRDAAGVDCTGTSDSTTAFAAWLASVPNASRIDIGSCRIRTGPIDLHGRYGLHFVGTEDNSGCTSTTAGGFYWNGQSGGGTLFLVDRSEDIYFENLSFDSLVTSNGPGVMLDMDEISRSGSGITSNIKGDRLCISTNESAHTGFVGIRVANTSTSNVEDIHFTNTLIGCGNGLAGQAGFQIGGSGGGANAFSETFDGGGMHGCAIDYNLLAGSQIRIADTLGGGQKSVVVGGAASVQLLNNRWEDLNLSSGGYAIDISNSTGTILDMRGNTITGPSGASVFKGAVYSSGGGITSLTLSGNYFSGFSNTFVASTVINNTPQIPTLVVGPNTFPDTPNWNFLAFCGETVLGTNCSKGWTLTENGELLNNTSTLTSPPFTLTGAYYSGSSIPDSTIFTHIPTGSGGTSGVASYLVISHPSGSTSYGISLPPVLGGLSTSTLTTPTIDSVTTTGTAGSTSYSYKIVANDGAGGTTAASSASTTTTGNATLSGSNCNQVNFKARTGAYSYGVYRTASGGTASTTGLIGTIFPSSIAGGNDNYLFTDCGLAGNGVTPPATNTTGQLISTISTGLAPFSVVSTTPVANLTLTAHPQVYEAGVLTASEKIYTNTQALTTGSATHTFANRFSFTSSSTFGCTCTDQTAANACKAVPASATTVTLAGNGSDVLWLSCSGH